MLLIDAVVEGNTIDTHIYIRGYEARAHLSTMIVLPGKALYNILQGVYGGKAWPDRPRAITRRARKKGKGKKQQISSRL